MLCQSDKCRIKQNWSPGGFSVYFVLYLSERRRRRRQRQRHSFNGNKNCLQRKKSERKDKEKEISRPKKGNSTKTKTKQKSLIEIHFQGFEIRCVYYTHIAYLIHLLFGFLVDPMVYFDIVDTYRLNTRNNKTDEKSCQTAIKFNCFWKESISMFMGEKQSGKCLQFSNCSFQLNAFLFRNLWPNLLTTFE